MTGPYWDLAHEAVNRHHAQQNIGELAAVLDLVTGLDPLERVLEIGVGSGGMLWVWARLGLEAVAVSAPIPGTCETHGARVLWADSHVPVSAQWVRTLAGARGFDVLLIDGDHEYAGAVADWRMYRRFVRPGGLILIHDVEQLPGPERLWAEITTAEPEACVTVGGSDPPVGCGVYTVAAREEDDMGKSEVEYLVDDYRTAVEQGRGTDAETAKKRLAALGFTARGNPIQASESKPAAAESRQAAAVAEDAPSSEAPRGRTAPRDRQQKA